MVIGKFVLLRKFVFVFVVVEWRVVFDVCGKLIFCGECYLDCFFEKGLSVFVSLMICVIRGFGFCVCVKKRVNNI